MKDPNDPYTPDLFDPARQQTVRTAKNRTIRQRYYNPYIKRLDMFIARRSFVQLDELVQLRGCTKRQLVEDLLEQEWQAAKMAMTQAELPGI